MTINKGLPFVSVSLNTRSLYIYGYIYDLAKLCRYTIECTFNLMAPVLCWLDYRARKEEDL